MIGAFSGLIMSADSLKCSVCGGTMQGVKALSTKLGQLIRFKCTCGHCEDLRDDTPVPRGKNRQALVLDGFQELP
jgi:hypothetical protein